MERIRLIEKAKSVSKTLLRQSTKETTVRIIPVLHILVRRQSKRLKPLKIQLRRGLKWI